MIKIIENIFGHFISCDFRTTEMTCAPPPLPKSEHLCIFFASNKYPSPFAKKLLLNYRLTENEPLSEESFLEIAEKYPDIIFMPEIYDDDWISSFVSSSLNIIPTEKNIFILNCIYSRFFDVIATKKNDDINLELFLSITENPAIPFLSLYHCRILAAINLKNISQFCNFDPFEIKKLSEKETNQLHRILMGNDSSESHIIFAISYCLPSANCNFENWNQFELPNLYFYFPEPQVIFYQYTYFSDEIYDLCTFLLQTSNCFINFFNEKFTRSDEENSLVLSLMNILINFQIISGCFLRAILIHKKSDEIFHHLSEFLIGYPSLRLSILENNQYLLSFLDLYYSFKDSIFNPRNGIFFIHFQELSDNPDNILSRCLSPYWMPADELFIYKEDDCTMFYHRIMLFLAKVNRIRIESNQLLNRLHELEIHFIECEVSDIIDGVLRINDLTKNNHSFSNILFVLISQFFQILQDNSSLITKQDVLRDMSLKASIKSMNFLLTVSPISLPVSNCLAQKFCYLSITRFIELNRDIFKPFIRHFNSVTSLLTRFTVIQYLHPEFNQVLFYFQLLLHTSSKNVFWVGYKFLRSLEYHDQDIEILQRSIFELNEPLTKINLCLYIYELVMHKPEFGKDFVNGKEFNNFLSKMMKYIDTVDNKVSEAALYLLYSLFKANAITYNRFIEYRELQSMLDDSQKLSLKAFETLFELIILICKTYNLSKFPFKLRNVDAMKRPQTYWPRQFFLFLNEKYPKVAEGIHFLDEVEEENLYFLMTDENLSMSPKPYSFLSLNKKRYNKLIAHSYYKAYLLTDASGNRFDLKNFEENEDILEHEDDTFYNKKHEETEIKTQTNQQKFSTDSTVPNKTNNSRNASQLYKQIEESELSDSDSSSDFEPLNVRSKKPNPKLVKEEKKKKIKINLNKSKKDDFETTNDTDSQKRGHSQTKHLHEIVEKHEEYNEQPKNHQLKKSSKDPMVNAPTQKENKIYKDHKFKKETSIKTHDDTKDIKLQKSSQSSEAQLQKERKLQKDVIFKEDSKSKSETLLRKTDNPQKELLSQKDTKHRKETIPKKETPVKKPNRVQNENTSQKEIKLQQNNSHDVPQNGNEKSIEDIDDEQQENQKAIILPKQAYNANEEPQIYSQVSRKAPSSSGKVTTQEEAKEASNETTNETKNEYKNETNTEVKFKPILSKASKINIIEADKPSNKKSNYSKKQESINQSDNLKVKKPESVITVMKSETSKESELGQKSSTSDKDNVVKRIQVLKEFLSQNNKSNDSQIEKVAPKADKDGMDISTKSSSFKTLEKERSDLQNEIDVLSNPKPLSTQEKVNITPSSSNGSQNKNTVLGSSSKQESSIDNKSSNNDNKHTTSSHPIYSSLSAAAQSTSATGNANSIKPDHKNSSDNHRSSPEHKRKKKRIVYKEKKDGNRDYSIFLSNQYDGSRDSRGRDRDRDRDGRDRDGRDRDGRDRDGRDRGRDYNRDYDNNRDYDKHRDYRNNGNDMQHLLQQQLIQQQQQQQQMGFSFPGAFPQQSFVYNPYQLGMNMGGMNVMGGYPNRMYQDGHTRDGRGRDKGDRDDDHRDWNNRHRQQDGYRRHPR
ncbi:hypothetical protein TRFO_02985 [Tritrichomonas foetus]|uniref:Uncharacterized protein n=1 Tax=Tritrichomonas foetus TaxID=1144522 RepID=A0A1J4KV13_9EUKA|nr:hypothetical protein TRFO_02985 [Tritrichomonas foetus]|eukprot:OHT14728.1 hypothetical protein TRFO_02985 [Tritrichomonas foetus]